MKIYIEFIYIINFLLDFMILYGTKRLLKINNDFYKIILGSLIGSLSTILINVKISNSGLFLVKVLLSCLMVIVSFGQRNFFRNIFYFYLLSIILGGLFYLFDFNVSFYSNFVIILILSPIILYLIVREFINHKCNINDKYDVYISYDKKTYRLEGFIDTGNRLKSPISNKSVILVNLKIRADNVIYVPYAALNSSGVIPCIKPDKVVINNTIIDNCLIGLAKDKFKIDGNCILPNILKGKLENK